MSVTQFKDFIIINNIQPNLQKAKMIASPTLLNGQLAVFSATKFQLYDEKNKGWRMYSYPKKLKELSVTSIFNPEYVFF